LSFQTPSIFSIYLPTMGFERPIAILFGNRERMLSANAVGYPAQEAALPKQPSASLNRLTFRLLGRGYSRKGAEDAAILRSPDLALILSRSRMTG